MSCQVHTKDVHHESSVLKPGSIIQEFGLNTTMHGIPGIARSQSWHNRIFWSVTSVVFSGLMLFFIIQSIQAFLQYPTQTTVNISSEWPQKFPAFTICNLSPIRFDRLVDDFLNYTNSINLTNTNDTNTMSAAQILFAFEFIRQKLNRLEDISDYFYSLSSMLYSCSYNGIPCTVSDFSAFMSSNYGFCYTFNGKMKASANKSSIHYAHENGEGGRLSMGLYIHDHLYMPYSTLGTGIICVVHDNAQIPIVNSDGIELAPGFRHRLTYMQKLISYLPSPYSTCTEEIPRSMRAVFDYYNGTDYAYSESYCYMICAQVFSYVKCGCVNPNLWDLRAIVLPDTDTFIISPLCNGTDPCYKMATHELLTSSNVLQKYCSACSSKCTTINFVVRTSSSTTPPDWLLGSIKEFVERSSLPLAPNWLTQWRQHIQNNFLAIDLIRESTVNERYEQSATMSAIDLLSNVGGQTGLWIGISLLSLIEIVELLYRLIRYQYFVVRRSLRQRMVAQS